jgi:hypothetical protein
MRFYELLISLSGAPDLAGIVLQQLSIKKLIKKNMFDWDDAHLFSNIGVQFSGDVWKALSKKYLKSIREEYLVIYQNVIRWEYLLWRDVSYLTFQRLDEANQMRCLNMVIEGCKSIKEVITIAEDYWEEMSWRDVYATKVNSLEDKILILRFANKCREEVRVKMELDLLHEAFPSPGLYK